MSDEEDVADMNTDHFMSKIVNHIQNPNNKSEDFSKPYLRPVFVTTYPILIFLYSLLIVCGIIMNIYMLYHIIKFKLHRDPTHAFLVNMIISDIIKCVFVLPITLAVMLIDNWIFGKFLCYFLPILQDAPLHISMMTYMLIAVDRFRMICDPRKPRIPAFVCTLGTWFFAGCIVLPYPIYTTYLDLGAISQQKSFEGLGMCFANLADDMQEYLRGLFIGTYVAPLAIITYLYVKASQELQSSEGPPVIGMQHARGSDMNIHRTKRESHNAGDSVRAPLDLYEDELDIIKETRSQKYLIFMVVAFAVCLCPLMILRLARLAIHETYKNSAYFDVTYTVFVWIAFLQIITTPGIYASWQMSSATKERLRGYFRFSNRHLTHCEDGAIQGSELQRNVNTDVQLQICQIGSISGGNGSGVVGCSGSARGSVRGSSSNSMEVPMY